MNIIRNIVIDDLISMLQEIKDSRGATHVDMSVEEESRTVTFYSVKFVEEQIKKLQPPPDLDFNNLSA